MLNDLRDAIFLKEEQEMEENLLTEMIDNLPEDEELEDYVLSGECQVDNIVDGEAEDEDIFEESLYFSDFDI